MSDEPTMTDVDFYNAHEGSHGRPKGNVYLDEVERYHAETLRAAAEGREPDYEHASATAGTPLITKDKLPDNSVHLVEVVDEGAEPTVEPFVTLPVDLTEAEQEIDYSDQDQFDSEVTGEPAEEPPSITGAETSNGTLNPPVKPEPAVETENLAALVEEVNEAAADGDETD